MKEMRKGYFIVILFALITAILGAIKYRYFEHSRAGEGLSNGLIFQVVLSFIVFVIPGLLLVRWYYQMKGK